MGSAHRSSSWHDPCARSPAVRSNRYDRNRCRDHHGAPGNYPAWVAAPATNEERLLLSIATKPAMLAPVLAQLAHTKFIFRPELYDGLRQAALMLGIPLSKSTRRVQARRAADGRRVAQRAIGSTLLLKGLECDHAVVLDADDMSANDLYVSLGRACHSVKVISSSPLLPRSWS